MPSAEFPLRTWHHSGLQPLLFSYLATMASTSERVTTLGVTMPDTVSVFRDKKDQKAPPIASVATHKQRGVAVVSGLARNALVPPCLHRWLPYTFNRNSITGIFSRVCQKTVYCYRGEFSNTQAISISVDALARAAHTTSNRRKLL